MIREFFVYGFFPLGGVGGGHRDNNFFYNENENFVNISQTSNNVHGHGLFTGFHGI